MEELWLNIPNYEEYEVSNFGRVKSLKNNTRKNQILNTSIDKKGYHRVFLYTNKKRKCFKVSVLVAITFLNHTPSKHLSVIDHVDNNKANNRLDNLQILTNRENCSKDKSKKTSKYTGVFWNKHLKGWMSSVYYNGKNYMLGYSKNEDVVAEYYKKALQDIEFGIEPSYNKKQKRLSK